MTNYNNAIDKLLTNRKITRIDTFGTLDGELYAAIYFNDKLNENYIILIDCDELWRLVGAVLTISSSHDYKYLRLNHKEYFHRIVMRPAIGQVTHHTAFFNGDLDTFDCRKSHLVNMDSNEHLQFHADRSRKSRKSSV